MNAKRQQYKFIHCLTLNHCLTVMMGLEANLQLISSSQRLTFSIILLLLLLLY